MSNIYSVSRISSGCSAFARHVIHPSVSSWKNNVVCTVAPVFNAPLSPLTCQLRVSPDPRSLGSVSNLLVRTKIETLMLFAKPERPFLHRCFQCHLQICVISNLCLQRTSSYPIALHNHRNLNDCYLFAKMFVNFSF